MVCCLVVDAAESAAVFAATAASEAVAGKFAAGLSVAGFVAVAAVAAVLETVGSGDFVAAVLIA